MEGLADVLATGGFWAGAVGGLGTGIVASLLAPWVQWAVEKRRFQLERRQELVDDFRQALADHEGDIREFGGSPEYAALRPYMDPEVVEEWEDHRKFFVTGHRHTEPRRHMLLDEVTRIEQEWGLV